MQKYSVDIGKPHGTLAAAALIESEPLCGQESASTTNSSLESYLSEPEKAYLPRKTTLASLHPALADVPSQGGLVRANLLAVLHRTRTSALLIMLLLARVNLLGIASIHGAKLLHISSTAAKQLPLWAVVPDAVLASLIAVILPLTVVLELWVLKGRFFSTASRTADFFVSLPLTVASAGLAIRVCLSRMPPMEIVGFLHYASFMPVLLVLLFSRLRRAQEGTFFSKTEKPMEENVPEVDFIWTSKSEETDSWLVSELSSMEDGTDMRLHRYVTRAESVDVEGLSHLESVNTGRPDWENVFGRVVRGTRSGGTVGVFFCGPKKMEDDVKRILRNVEKGSALKGAFIRRGGWGEGVREWGCGVRMVFRKENFG